MKPLPVAPAMLCAAMLASCAVDRNRTNVQDPSSPITGNIYSCAREFEAGTRGEAPDLVFVTVDVSEDGRVLRVDVVIDTDDWSARWELLPEPVRNWRPSGASIARPWAATELEFFVEHEVGRPLPDGAVAILALDGREVARRLHRAEPSHGLGVGTGFTMRRMDGDDVANVFGRRVMTISAYAPDGRRLSRQRISLPDWEWIGRRLSRALSSIAADLNGPGCPSLQPPPT